MDGDIQRKHERRAGFLRPTEKPKETPTERAERKMGLQKADDNPLSNPMWLGYDAFEERIRVRKAYEIADSPGTDWNDYGGGGARVELNNGESVSVYDLRLRMDRKAYDLIVAGVDERTIAAMCHMTVSEVQALKARHGIV